MFEALDSAGWNSVPDICDLTYAELREQCLQRWCPDSVLQPNLKVYLEKRNQREKESVQEFAEAFLILTEQLIPRPSEQEGIALFED